MVPVRELFRQNLDRDLTLGRGRVDGFEHFSEDGLFALSVAGSKEMFAERMETNKRQPSDRAVTTCRQTQLKLHGTERSPESDRQSDKCGSEGRTMKMRWQAVYLLVVLVSGWNLAEAQNVKITPVGQRTGEFCAQDRAMLFEDPTGVRILYDPGNTVAGGTDARLGDVHVILISHAHSDHLGNGKLNQDPDSSNSSCSSALTTPAANSNTAEIAAAKQSAVVAGGPLATTISRLIAAVVGSPNAGCPASGLTNEMTVPLSSACTAGLGLGAKRTVRHVSAIQGVQITAVTAQHTNELSSLFVAGSEKTDLSSNALGAYVGLANGFVVTFTNGLKAYLSGDTGLTSDMNSIVRGYYRADLVVINMGDIFTTGPEEAAFAVTELIRPASVIPSHVNEAATHGGVPNPGSKTARFLDLLKAGSNSNGSDDKPSGVGRISVFLPLSGVTMEFDGQGRCEVGCQGR
jgi:L-ascorbate metabolism protein UlaG (beta-lactamase superfamily)